MSELITNLIVNNSPFIFVKLGDGEYNAANGYYGSNCDGDNYTPKLKNGIIEAVRYYSTLKNSYCGCWHTDRVSSYFDSIVSNKLKWIDYHTCIIDSESLNNNKKLYLFKAIKQSKRTKIYISNELMSKVKYLLDIDFHITVPYRNWINSQLDDIIKNVTEYIKDDKEPLILTSAGMGSKVLIMELHKLFPNGIFIDIGSGLDYLCTKKCSRGNTYSYDTLEKYFEEILPDNWNDSKFEYIYTLAKHNIGIHLPK